MTREKRPLHSRLVCRNLCDDQQGDVPFVSNPIIALHTVTNANEDMADTVIESDFNATACKQQHLLKSILKSPSEITSELSCTWAYLDVVAKTGVEAIVENCLTNWTELLQLQMIKPSSTHSESHYRPIILTIILASNLLFAPFWTLSCTKCSNLGVLQRYQSPRCPTLSKTMLKRTQSTSPYCPTRDSSFRSQKMWENGE